MKLLKPILYTDMDGTLLNGQHAISHQNLSAIQEYTAAGGLFSIATGRSEAISEPFAAQLPITLPAILYNGAAIYDFARHCFLHTVLLPDPCIETILETSIRTYPEICIEGFMEGPIRLLNPAGQMDPYITKESQPFTVEAHKPGRHYIKFLLFGDPDRLRLVHDALAPQVSRFCTLIFSAPFYLEILPLSISKGTALVWISEHLQRPLEQFCAVGDYDNDAQMLSLAGLGAAPANGSIAAKRAASLLLRSHEEHALEDLIHNHLFMKEKGIPI